MQWFYDLKTKAKMNVLIASMSIGMFIIGFTGYYFNAKANDAMGQMYEIEFQLTEAISSLNAHFNANRANELNLIFETNPKVKQELMNNISERAEKGNVNISSLRKIIKESKNEELLSILDNVNESLAKYREIRVEELDFAQNGNKIKAYDKFKANNYYAKKLSEEINLIIENLSESADKKYLAGQTNATISSIVIFLTMILTLVFCSWLGMLTASRIAGLLGKLGEKMKSLANGDLTIESLGRPEGSCIGDLCVVFDTMLNNLKHLVKEVAKSAEDVSANSEELSSAAEQTALGAQQVATSITQLAAGAQQVAGSVTLLAQGSNDVANNIEESSTNLNKINK